MRKFKKLSLTLALLLTAVGGAWAADTYTITFSGFGNEAYNKTVTDAALEYSETFFVNDVDADYIALNDVGGSNEYVSISQAETQITITVKSAFEGTVNVTVYYVNGDGDEAQRNISVTCVKNAPAIEVTTNKASEQDLFTEASFTMPAFDATAEYELVRDMQDEANPVAFSGLPSSDNIVVKKGDDGKYQPAEALTIQLNDALISGDDKNIITATDLTVTVEKKGDGDTWTSGTFADFMADMQPGTYRLTATPTDENSPYDGTVYSSEFTVEEQYDLTVKPANNYSKGKMESVTVGTETVTPDATTGKATKTGVAPDTEVKLKAKRGYIIEKVEAKKTEITMLNAATTENIGMVVCNKGHLHDAKTAVPAGCTAVGILGKVTETGHGLILALKNATNQNWNTINGWASASYAGTTLKVLPDDAARGTNLTSYTTLGETTVSNWAVAQKSDYVAIFTNLGSTKNSGGMTYDNNVNAYITTGVGGTAMSGTYWSATQDDDYDAWYFHASSWYDDYNTSTYYVRPVLGF